MKSLALAITLVLHATGLWPHLSGHARTELTSAAASPAIVSAAPVTLAGGTLGMPIRIATAAPTYATSESVLALDAATATPLYAQNIGQKRPIASVTKLITALVILSRHKTTELVTIGQLPSYQPEDDILGFVPGETYQLGDLVRAALIPSANDAADALAIYDSGTITRFAAQMNIKMNQWGIVDTHFVSPSGLQDENNYATALSLSRIAALALTNPFIRDTVNQSSVSLASTAGRTLHAASTNQLLASGHFYGIKTGYTLRAGECFVGLTQVNGHNVITVVLGASDRFGDTQTLTTWIGTNWVWL